jgi:Reverse transcriptase (RNA-dependent DNA polymerase)
MYIDYRMLNARTKKNIYFLPLISDCLQQIGNARYISKIDLTSGYWQVLIAETDIEKTAFNTRDGKYEFVAIPFGFTNVSAIFQSIINEIFRPFLDIFCIIYLDDIVIYFDSAKKHEKYLTKILECLSTHELIIKSKKSIIGAREIEFCGFLVKNNIVKPSLEKTSIIQDWPIPKTVHEIRQFLDLASYYRRFI